MPDGGDWLSSLASKVGTVGSFIAKSLIPAYGLYEQWKDPNASAANLLAGTRAATGMAGEAMSAISDKDPSKLLWIAGMRRLRNKIYGAPATGLV